MARFDHYLDKQTPLRRTWGHWFTLEGLGVLSLKILAQLSTSRKRLAKPPGGEVKDLLLARKNNAICLLQVAPIRQPLMRRFGQLNPEQQSRQPSIKHALIDRHY